MRILSILAHPDDMELHCAGTLLKFKKAGHTVISCHVANGNMGHMVIQPDELRDIRRKEAVKASTMVGFECVTADIGDLTVNAADEEQKMKVLKIIREAKPDLIITHAPNDYMIDHREVSKLAFDMSFAASCPHFHPELGEAVPLMPLYYTSTSDNVDFQPTEFVDVTEEFETVADMLRCHESQLVWLKDHDGIDVVENQRTLAASLGMQCGVKYAEGFAPCLVSGRMRTYRMLP